MRHVEECERCRELLAATWFVRDALEPASEVTDELMERTLAAIDEARAAEHRRSWSGVAATFVLAFLTAAPVALAGHAAGDGSPEGLLLPVAVAMAVAVATTALEPKYVVG